MMKIIMDLEWNQPVSYNTAAYKRVGDKLIFEMIQIGAVKVNENKEIVDSFSQLILPTHYVKLHPRIKRITHITQDELMDAPHFKEALDLFREWCGDDFVLMTWGCDDVSVLEQNITFFGCENTFGPIYDLQLSFGDVIQNSKDRKGLKAAMEYYELTEQEDMPFHNALNDAYYTALVCNRLPDDCDLLRHPQTPRPLIHTEKKKKASRSVHRATKSISHMLLSALATNPPCPICGNKTPLETDFLDQGKNNFTALSICPAHGLMSVTLKFKKDEEGKAVVERAISLTEEQDKAYVSTKVLQWNNKIAKQSLLKKS